MKLRTIHLDGKLAEYCKTSTVELAGDTLQVLARGLISRFGIKVKQILAESNWQVYKDRLDEDGSIDYKTVEDKLDSTKDVYILAPVEGSGRTGAIILGVVLIVVGIITIVYSGGSSSVAIAQGIGMIAGGAMTIYSALTTPKAQQQRAAPDENASFVFNGATNVIEQGGAVPLIYGRCLAGSTIVSAGIDAEQMQKYTSPLGHNIAPNSKFNIEDV